MQSWSLLQQLCHSGSYFQLHLCRLTANLSSYKEKLPALSCYILSWFQAAYHIGDSIHGPKSQLANPKGSLTIVRLTTTSTLIQPRPRPSASSMKLHEASVPSWQMQQQSLSSLRPRAQAATYSSLSPRRQCRTCTVSCEPWLLPVVSSYFWHPCVTA